MMNDGVDDRARRARAAVHDRTAGLDADRGLAQVVRRGDRPRPATVLAVLLVVALAVPAGGWLRALTDTRVELQQPADEPDRGIVEPEPTPGSGSDEGSPPAEDPAPGDPPAPEISEPQRPDPQGAEPQDPEPRGPEPAGPFGTEEVATEGFPLAPAGDTALLTDVRVASHDGFDRIVLAFRGGTPGYRVAYVDPPITQDGSGEEVAVAGEAFLELHLTPASGWDAVEGAPTYTGPDRVTGPTTTVTEVVATGDFEANLSWVVGLDTRAPFSVTLLADPVRLVVDVQTS